MTTDSRWRLAFTLIAFVVASPTSADAQVEGAGRAFRGLFDSDRDVDARQKLDVTLLVNQAYDSDVPRTLVEPIALRSRGYSTLGIGNAVFSQRLRRIEVAATASSILRYYPDVERLKNISDNAHIELTTTFPAGTLSFSQGVTYSTFVVYDLLPAAAELGAVSAAPEEYGINANESYTYRTAVALRRRVGRRSSVSATGDFDRVNFVRESTSRADQAIYGVGGGYSVGLSRAFSLTAAYQHRGGDYRNGEGSTQEDTAEIGIDYRRRLSATRSTGVVARLGSSTIDTPQLLNVESTLHRLYRLNGDVEVHYEFGRLWQISAVFRRGVEFVTHLPEPVTVSGATTSLQGSITERATFLVLGSFSRGASVLGTANRPYAAYRGNARLTYQVSRLTVASAEYIYYMHDFRGDSWFGPEIASGFSRHGVRVGLGLAMPVLRR
jgi:hypothetical protein